MIGLGSDKRNYIFVCKKFQIVKSHMHPLKKNNWNDQTSSENNSNIDGYNLKDMDAESIIREASVAVGAFG